MAATIVALPVLGIIIGGAIQFGLIFEAKATLNHAVLQAARLGRFTVWNLAKLGWVSLAGYCLSFLRQRILTKRS